MGHLISIIALAYLLYIVGGGLLIFIHWICSNKYRLTAAVIVIGMSAAYIESRPDPPPFREIYQWPAYEESKPTKPVYVTRVLGMDSYVDSDGNSIPFRIEKKISLDECKALPGYRGVTYGICVIR